MIDPDVLRQLTADLKVKVDDRLAVMVGYSDQGDEEGASYCRGRIDAYADVAAQIRAILAAETTEQEDA